MEAGDQLNYLALNQDIFGKIMCIGKGFSEGTDKIPEQTPLGFKVYLNGRHKLPKFSKINEVLHIGKIQYPSVMIANAGAELIYELGICKNAYLIIIRLKIDESVNGGSEAAVDALAITKRADLPPNMVDDENLNGWVSKAMMFCHFMRLFEFYKTKDDLENWEIEGDFINHVVDEYFEYKATLKHTGDES